MEPYKINSYMAFLSGVDIPILSSYRYQTNVYQQLSMLKPTKLFSAESVVTVTLTVCSLRRTGT